nr:hypothetical protein [Tanacetum cinerariifolium]
HVDLGAQYAGAVFELTGFHAGKQVQVFLDAALTERAVLARLGQGATVFAGLFRGQVIDISLAGLDQLDRPVVQLV